VGEANRRRRAIETGAPISYTLPGGGKDTARQAPSVKEFAEQMRDMEVRDERGEYVAAKVPCNGCTACCYHDMVDFEPARERPEDLAHLDYEPIAAEPGHAKLRKRADGGCIHLGPAGCMVHAHRPKVCRLYDCRAFLLAGISQEFEGGRSPPKWVPDRHTVEQRVWDTALRLGGMKFILQQQGKPFYADDAVRAAWRDLPETLPIVAELAKHLEQIGPAATEKLFGPALTAEEFAALMRKIYPTGKLI